jgi:hypothetical protein
MSRDYPSSTDFAGSPPPAYGHDDAGIEELLREVGARAEPSAELTTQVHAAVYAEWRALVQGRERRRRGVGLALAAGVVGLVAATIVTVRIGQPPDAGPRPLASIVRVNGHPQIEVAGQLHEAALGEVLAPGMRLLTGDSSLALDFGHDAQHLSLRVDAGTQLRFSKLDSIELQAGALYVDAGNTEQSATLTVQTVAGAVRHVGTQYQVRTVGGSMPGIEVSVREGRVEIASDHGTNTGNAGELIALSTAGAVSRRALPAHDLSWQWAAGVAPPFDIEGRPLTSFLEWVSRETGRQLTYDSPEAQQAAATVQMVGSITKLPLDMAIPAVLSTTNKVKLAALSEKSLRITLKRD